MKKNGKRLLGVVIIGIVLMTTCTGCVTERKSPFFSMIENEYEDSDAAIVLENFCEYVQNTDFTEFDYAYHQGEHKYQPEYVTQIDAYRNVKNAVFCANTKEAEYYYNKAEGLLHCDMKANGEISDLEGKQLEWAQLPFDEAMEKAYHMLAYLCDSKDYLQLEYEEKMLADWDCKNLLTISYSERRGKETQEWDNRTPEWEEQFGECGPYSIKVFCDDEGMKFLAISMTWYEGALRYTVTWNSYDEIIQSDRCVIRYEYEHGLRTDNVPRVEEQKEQLKKEIEENPLYD